MNKGDRVSTPGGDGTVMWVRMAAPDYNKPCAVSVVLDSRQMSCSYTGTVYPAEQVTPIKEGYLFSDY